MIWKIYLKNVVPKIVFWTFWSISLSYVLKIPKQIIRNSLLRLEILMVQEEKGHNSFT